MGSTLIVSPDETIDATLVLHANAACPLMRIPQDPQMAPRHEQRKVSDSSTVSRILINASRTVSDRSVTNW